MIPIVSVWIQFLFLALIIGFAGYRLTYYADKIADRTGFARNWIGLVLLATITSLPELMTGISSVRWVENPNLAIGDALGSCVFNLGLVFILDFLYRQGSIYKKSTQGHILSGTLGITLLGFVGLGIAASGIRLLNVRIGHVGVYAAIIPVLYLISMRTLFLFERRLSGRVKVSDKSVSMKNIFVFFGLAALVVIGAGVLLPFIGNEIIQLFGWNSIFVGTLFIAFATSLPEIAVTIGALRLKVPELAFSTLLGSNLFNTVAIFVEDLFYTEGPILQSVSAVHSVTALSAIMMTGLVVIALIQPPQKRILNTVSLMSLLLLGVYIFNTYVVFTMGK